MSGQDILCAISKGTFEIPHKKYLAHTSKDTIWYEVHILWVLRKYMYHQKFLKCQCKVFYRLILTFDPTGERRIDPCGDSVARTLARRTGGSVAVVLRGTQCQGHVVDLGAASQHDGKRTSDAEGILLHTGTMMMVMVIKDDDDDYDDYWWLMLNLGHVVNLR